MISSLNGKDLGMREPALDEVELVHLALHAMRSDRHEEAIGLLKRAVQAFPDSAKAHYLLGAEHAQIGLYDRAVEEIAAAVRLDPDLPAARFQLGLLHLTAGRVQEAESTWKPLEQLPANDPLRLFKSALLHLVRDEFEQCMQDLRAGMAHNKLNSALNEDMRRLLTDLESRHGSIQAGSAASAHATPEPLPPLQTPKPSKRLLLSTYDLNSEAGPGDPPQ